MAPPAAETPLDDIPAIHSSVKKAFASGKLRSIAFRREQLAQAAYLIQDNFETLQDVLFQDHGKPRMETYFEVMACFQCALDFLRDLDTVTADVDVSSEVQPIFAGFKPRLIKQPIGVVLLITPFNAPIGLVFAPLIAAIAAGCPVVVKPSELTPNCSSLISRLINQYLDPECYRTVIGGSEQATRLLELKWGYVNYTGGIRVGKIVAAAAAKFLTPATIELGGKCPVVIEKDYDMEVAARRILSGKMYNAGQICVSPDYVLVPSDRQDALVAGLEKAWHEFFPAGSLESPDMGRIINERHYKRVKDILDRTKGGVVLGGKQDPSRLKMDVTVVRDVHVGDSLLEDEIFGPILAIVPVDSIEAAVEFISEHPEPLAMYMFSENEAATQYVKENTMSGSFILNVTLWQLGIPELPVGGIGASGYGYQLGKYAFNAFSHLRPSINVSKEFEPVFAARYPPYTMENYDVLAADRFQQIPVPRAK